ncbi:MAG TPA: phosphotransferase family protein [Pseudonocardia sp.]
MTPPGPASLRDRAHDLGPYLTKMLGGDASVSHIALASEGMSATTLLVDLADGRQIVLRGRGAVKTSAYDMEPDEVQFHVLRAVEQTRVPAPPALFYEPDPGVLGVPFLATGRLPGSAVMPWSRAGRAFLTEVGGGPAGEQLLDILVAIHSVPVEHNDLAHVFGPPPASVSVAVTRLRETIEKNAVGPEPILTDALGWLAANLPDCPDPALVHGDFRAGNLLFEANRISGILDWEFAHLGDPTRDLAWLMAKSNRTSDDLACDMIPTAEVLERYRKAGGREIEPGAIAFWDVFMLVEMVGIWLGSTATWRAGELHDVRVARWTYTLPTLRLMVLDALEGVAR